jgi:ubiquinone/menaquinone biosynthesis C-methylase UbiE
MRRPRFIAEQARNARGPLGWLIAFIMARETWAQNQRAIASLDVQDGDHVLDLGCGHGRSLAALAERTPRGRVVGADPSQLMVDIAAARNRDLVRDGRVHVAVAPAEALPFGRAAFDKVLCVHVIYFWPNLQPSLAEIARVLKPGGRLAILCRTSETASVEAFPRDVYSFRPLGEITVALSRAGLEAEDLARVGDCALMTARRAA